MNTRLENMSLEELEKELNILVNRRKDGGISPGEYASRCHEIIKILADRKVFKYTDNENEKAWKRAMEAL